MKYEIHFKKNVLTCSDLTTEMGLGAGYRLSIANKSAKATVAFNYKVVLEIIL